MAMLAFRTIALDETHPIEVCSLPGVLVPNEAAFQALWALHAADFHEIKISVARAHAAMATGVWHG
jgi:hypothetical protein